MRHLARLRGSGKVPDPRKRHCWRPCCPVPSAETHGESASGTQSLVSSLPRWRWLLPGPKIAALIRHHETDGKGESPGQVSIPNATCRVGAFAARPLHRPSTVCECTLRVFGAGCCHSRTDYFFPSSFHILDVSHWASDRHCGFSACCSHFLYFQCDCQFRATT